MIIIIKIIHNFYHIFLKIVFVKHILFIFIAYRNNSSIKMYRSIRIFINVILIHVDRTTPVIPDTPISLKSFRLR